MHKESTICPFSIGNNWKILDTNGHTVPTYIDANWNYCVRWLTDWRIKSRAIKHLVFHAWSNIPNPDAYHIQYKDGNKANNHIDNLVPVLRGWYTIGHDCVATKLPWNAYLRNQNKLREQRELLKKQRKEELHLIYSLDYILRNPDDTTEIYIPQYFSPKNKYRYIQYCHHVHKNRYKSRPYDEWLSCWLRWYQNDWDIRIPSHYSYERAKALQDQYTTQ